MLHRQNHFENPGQSRCPFGMADDGFDTADVEGTESFRFFAAEEGFADGFCLYRVSGWRSRSVRFEKLRSVGLFGDVETSTSITVANQGYLST